MKGGFAGVGSAGKEEPPPAGAADDTSLIEAFAAEYAAGSQGGPESIPRPAGSFLSYFSGRPQYTIHSLPLHFFDT